MANLFFQSKINRQFWGKLIRHFSKTPGLQIITWGGRLTRENGSLTTFFHSVRRIE